MTKKIILGTALTVIFTLLIVGGGLFYAYKSGLFNKFLGSAAPTTVAVPEVGQPNTDQNPIVGNDKDAHGCIPSAGYTWCEVKQKCLRVWEEACEVDETAALQTAIIEELVKEHGEGFRQMNVTVSTIEGNFAKGGASGEGGGGMWLAAKVDGEWQLVWDGNGVIYCEDLAPYPDFPTSFVPECWNQATDSLVTR